LEVTVDSLEDAKLRLVKNGCEIIKDEPGFPRCYVKDPFELIYDLTSQRAHEVSLAEQSRGARDF
jgi:hypothetical protein